MLHNYLSSLGLYKWHVGNLVSNYIGPLPNYRWQVALFLGALAPSYIITMQMITYSRVASNAFISSLWPQAKLANNHADGHSC